MNSALNKLNEQRLAPRQKLALATKGGDPLVVEMSPGSERFIGRYPLIEEFHAPDGNFLILVQEA